MKRLLIAGAMMTLMVVPQAQIWGADDDFSPAQREQIRKMVQESLQGQGGAMGIPPAPGDEAPMVGDTTQQRVTFGQGGFTGGGGLQGGRSIYAKPFVKAPKATVGGYIDFIVTDCTNSAKDCDRGLTFDQERFIPFLYSQVTDRISVASEIEFEHGASNSAGGSASKSGKVVLEFATMDYRVSDSLNLRAGLILIPIGRFNLTHDTPLNDLPLRPIASRYILPSTFMESGIGIYGSFYPTKLAKVDYELYVVQGFDGGTGYNSPEGTTCTSCISESKGVASAKPSAQSDNNEDKSITGRIAISPFLGVEVAGSFHHGKWDSAGKNNLTLYALDWSFQRGPFEFIGESAWINIEGGNPTPVTSPALGYVPPAGMHGYFVQGNYHFLPETLKKWAPGHFTDASTFTAVVRYGVADTNVHSDSNTNDISRLTLGLNYRPIEDAVFKLAWTGNGERNSNTGSSNDGWQFQASTYF